MEPTAIKDIDVWMTMVGGEVVHCAAPDPALCLPGESVLSTDEAPTIDDSAYQNLALGQPVTVSSSLAWMAVDGDPETVWNSGSDAPQWIEIDLGRPRVLHGIRLTVAQNLAGETHHRAYGRGPDGDERLLAEFSGYTEDAQILTYVSNKPWTRVQYLRVETVASPAWVAWREIEVLR